MKRTLKEWTFSALCMLGVHHAFRAQNACRLLVLMYHGLRCDDDPSPPSWLLLPVSQFEAQIAFLRDHYDVIAVSEAARRLVQGIPFEKPTACITFDDGYRNNYTLGLPVLQQYQAPATIYLATGAIDSPTIHWTIRLERALDACRLPRLDLRNKLRGHFPLGPSTARTYVRLKERLYRMPSDDRQELLEAIFYRTGFNGKGDFAPFHSLSWAEAQAMLDTGLIEFGGHTIHHQITSCLGIDEARREIIGSMRAIEEHLGCRPLSFAYPNGTERDFTERAKRLAKEAGALVAFTSMEGLNGPGADPYALRRMPIAFNTSMAEFMLLTSGFLTQLRLRNQRWSLNPF